MLTDDPWNVFAGGRQHRVALLAGWNSAEIKSAPPTAAALMDRLKAFFPNDFEAAHRVYPTANDREATLPNVALISDGSFAYATWKWIEAHAATGRSPVYRYLFDQIVPTKTGDPSSDEPGAAHMTDIEYVFNTLDRRTLAWRPSDRRVADMMGAYWTNFARTGDPNGSGLPNWPALGPSRGRQIMRINADARVETERNRDRYEFHDILEHRKRGIK
jgi:para-nitrobenzyl esterase